LKAAGIEIDVDYQEAEEEDTSLIGCCNCGGRGHNILECS